MMENPLPLRRLRYKQLSVKCVCTIQWHPLNSSIVFPAQFKGVFIKQYQTYTRCSLNCVSLPSSIQYGNLIQLLVSWNLCFAVLLETIFTMQTRLSSYSQIPACFCRTSAEIEEVQHHAQVIQFLYLKRIKYKSVTYIWQYQAILCPIKGICKWKVMRINQEDLMVSSAAT